MRLFSLDERLALCASFVRPGKRIADVGTDHAYLPVYLISTKKCTHAIATDINEGPLNSGKECVEKYNLSNDIELRLCNGLEKVSGSEVDDIVIAGMGGDLIISILENSEFVKDSNIQLILQPMTKYSEVIKYLFDNGFEITKQKACTSNNKHYTVICASYSHSPITYSDIDLYIGKLDKRDHEAIVFLNQTIKHLENKSKGVTSLESIVNKLKETINDD